MDKTVIGIGEILWDVLPGGKRLGGAPANFAWHTAQMGHDGIAVSAVGDDNLGMEIKDTLDARGLHNVLQINDHPTGTVEVQVDASGIPAYDIKEDVAWDYLRFTPDLEALAARADAVCFGSLAQRSGVTRDTIRRFIAAMPKDRDVLRICDINLRQDFYTPDMIAESIRLCNIIKLNEDELQTMRTIFPSIAGGEDDQCCRNLLDSFGLRAVILTRGEDGSAVYHSGGKSALPTPKVDVADTVGAGDSFTAAFVSALLQGATVGEAHRLAVDVSAFVCTCHGAMPVLPDDLKRRLG